MFHRSASITRSPLDFSDATYIHEDVGWNRGGSDTCTDMEGRFPVLQLGLLYQTLISHLRRVRKEFLLPPRRIPPAGEGPENEVAVIDNTSSSLLRVRDDGRGLSPGARGLLFLVLGGIDDLAKATSQATTPELAPPMPPPSFLKLVSTAPNLSICSRTATLVVPGWTLRCAVE